MVVVRHGWSGHGGLLEQQVVPLVSDVWSVWGSWSEKLQEDVVRMGLGRQPVRQQWSAARHGGLTGQLVVGL